MNCHDKGHLENKTTFDSPMGGLNYEVLTASLEVVDNCRNISGCLEKRGFGMSKLRSTDN